MLQKGSLAYDVTKIKYYLKHTYETNNLFTLKFKIMKIKNLLFIALTGSLLFNACKKDGSTPPILISSKQIDPSKVFRIPETLAEKQLVENLAKTTEVFKELYKNKSNIKIVTAAIYSKTYTDESVLLKDLLYPQNSLLSNNKNFIKLSNTLGVKLEDLSKNFFEIVSKKNDNDFKAFLQNLNLRSDLNLNTNSLQTHSYYDVGYGDRVSIYYPYSETFQDDNGNNNYYEPITTIATATADADQGWASQPYYLNGELQGYNQVLIDDNYAEQNPTQIIGINGIEPYDYETNVAIGPIETNLIGTRVYLGEVICREQYDRLISFTGNGGGSELRYCRLSAYLKPVNQQVTSAEDVISKDFSRRDIKKERWLRIMSVWDAGWKSSNDEQILGIYEEDTEGTKEFTGSLSTDLDSLGLPIKGSVSYKHSVKTQDDIIRHLKITRSSYFGGAFNNQGQDFTGDRTFIMNFPNLRWPAYDVHYVNKTGANVGWTWPYNYSNN